MSIRNLIQRVAEKFVALTPKFRWAVLRGFPDYDDNCLAIYDGLASYGCSRVVWVVADPDATPPFAVRAGTRFVRRGSLADRLYCMFAKYLFITHGHSITRIPANQVCVNMWHGIPYKVIGKLDGRAGREDSMVVATSGLTREVFARVFGVGLDKVAVTGQARTDRMFVDAAEVKARLGLATDRDTKVFLWLPTYRTAQVGEKRVDGRDTGNVFNCTGFPAAEFDAWLAANNAICLVKPHPMAPPVAGGDTRNLLYIDDKWLRSRRVSLYQLAGAADCLVSDISSIVIDFLLLDRPIVLLFEDIAEYSDSRGFVFAPIADWLPARVNTGYEGFMDDMQAVLAGQDRYARTRARLKREFFEHDDAGSCGRILDLAFNDRAAGARAA